MSDLEIIDFDETLSADFAALNMAWLQKYFVAEPLDDEMLGNPQHHYIDKGGYIYFAKLNGEIAGTIALLKVAHGIFELSKMAVAPAFQGNKVGNRLVEFCIEKAAQLDAKKLILYSNTALVPAIYLYKKYGFVEVALEHSDYARANIKMELVLK